MKIILRAKIIEEQEQKRLEFVNPDYYKDVVNRLSSLHPVLVEIKNERPRRTGQQNRYWHGVCFPIIAELTGYTNEEAKALCRAMFLEPKFLEVQGRQIQTQKGTAELDKKEAMDFTDKIINLATELGGTILSPCEAGYFCGRDDCSICQAELKQLPTVYPQKHKTNSTLNAKIEYGTHESST